MRKMDCRDRDRRLDLDRNPPSFNAKIVRLSQDFSMVTAQHWTRLGKRK
ncbi:hypothetical protein MADA3029_1180054 [Vibrio nigripulchritudo MADA3029]|uniref:Uncharacterized protein n=1 Tax=Vibrio nigripulchritudo SOn1 TaxID=1238450 RepID=A0AAV2VPT1_9VIBR|nr:hypothetical protein VIBNIAM115_1300019 [Vibrio nigripulchritudo AM115]CCN43768.1 hypothetical protein VIBNIFTn2_600054 [Vibrio nigripulchritudo FTn2]CCN49109.1 hypothetical protein VIBNIMADA3020_70052 [Vibrio nigripulchritudo MADA3020]CCN56263.1 hypothetical protein VIBNIMADA3021_910052 [Vibrio nigripulchritudo MADA3021]CCN57830.1 hypothetical protein MADA3029_1180054 [Vibrio nigripulchritudo MADA3029]CCN65194.1 hypothetical protein VIBNIPon4_360019 [Vibrio nigripulchritudo POn4]CCN72113.